MRQKRARSASVSTHTSAPCSHGCIKLVASKARLQTHWTKNAGKPRSIRENATVDVGDDNQPRAARQGVTPINGPIHYFIDVHTMTVMYSYRISKAAAYRSTMGDPLKVKTISYKD